MGLQISAAQFVGQNNKRDIYTAEAHARFIWYKTFCIGTVSKIWETFMERCLKSYFFYPEKLLQFSPLYPRISNQQSAKFR